MKKKHLTYAKKTLSVFLAVLMLLTAWVFVPGEHNHASAAALVSATENYNKSLLSGINTNIDTTMPTVLGRFKDPNMEGDENASFHVSQYGSQHYKNIFYSPTVTSSDPAAKMTGISNIDSVMVYYPETVMIYDGSTKPQMGVVACLDGGSYAVRGLSVYISANANDLVITDHWKGSTTGNLAHIINMHNGSYMMSNDGTEHDSYKHNTADHGEWYFYASDLRFDGTLGATEFVRSIVPSWGFYGAYYRYYWLGNQTGTLTKITDVADKTIYVMNVKAYRDLLSTISTDKTNITNNAGRYTPESVKAYVNAANAIINLNPKNVSQSGSAVATWGSNMTTAYNNYVTAKSGLTNREFEVTYENIFSLADWKYSTSSEKANVTADLSAGKVTVQNPNASGEYVTPHSGSSSNANTRSTNHYAMPVVGGQEYTIRYTTDGADTQIFAFFYDANGGCTHEATFGNYNFTVKNDIGYATFKAPDNSTQMEIRFDNNTPASTANFWNIMIYPAARTTEVEPESWFSRPYRKLYTYNTAVGTLDVPGRDGYDFQKWMADTDGDGVADAEAPTGNITSGHVLYSTWTSSSYTLTFDGNGGTPSVPSLTYKNTDTVKFPDATRDEYAFDAWKVTTAAGNWPINSTYAANSETTGKYGNITLVAQWTKLWKVTFLDGAAGTEITSISVRNGEKVGTLPSVVPTKDSDETNSYEFDYWYGNGAKLDENTVITDNITVFPVFRSVAHEFEWADNPYKSATCTDPALVEKHCKTCGHSLGYVPYDGDNENWLAKGHEYTGGILANSSTGNTDNDTHSVKCVRYSTCQSVELVNHVWDGNASQGATCTTPGTIKKTCPCGAEKYVDGEIDPDAHNFDLTKGTSNNDKATHTVACTYNAAHTESVNCTDDNNDCECDVCGQELVHVYDKKTKDFVKSAADCYNDAVYYYTCQCGKQGTETWTDTGSMLPHNWTNTETNIKSAANCTDDEVYYKECSLCNVSSKDITGETWTKENTKWNHKFEGDYVNNNNGTHDRECVNAGCTATGATEGCVYNAWTTDNADTHSHTCKHCGYTPAAEAHKWTAWKTVDGATDTAAAQHTRSCETCGRVETKDCTYTSVETKNTCTEDGYTTHTCNFCSHEYVTAGTSKTGHDYTGTAKSYGDGTHNYLCKNGCGTYGFEAVEDKTTTCTYKYDNNKDGEHQATCKECNYTFAQKCSGGQATCTAPAVCEKCETNYGTTSPHSFTGTVVKLEGDKHAYLCVYCSTANLYGVGENQGATEDCSGGTATCTALAICDKCGDTHGDLDEDAHKWGAWKNIEGTETHKRVCEYNNAHEEVKDCFSPDIEVIAPDCETAGYTLNTCEFCGHEWQTAPTDPLGHDWSAWKNNEDGTHTRVCKDGTCKYGENGGAKTETVACTKENATFVVTEPTCTEGGYTTYTCKDCGYVWTADETQATGHSYLEKTKKAEAKYLRTSKDCVTDWTYWYCCDNCDVSAGTEEAKYDDITVLYWVREEATGHKYDAKTATETYLATPANCTAKATYYYSCSVCGASSEDTDDEATFEYGSALGHDWVEPAEDKLANYLATPADCITDATYYYVCNREGCGISSKGVKTDGETWTDTDSKTGHKFDYEGGYTAGVAADCVNTGVVEHYTCETCGKHFKADKVTEIAADKLVIAALRHDFEDVPKKDATCEEDGYTAHKQCQRAGCGYQNSDYEVIPAKGHEFKAENGYRFDADADKHSFKCTNCDDYGVDGVEDATVDCEFTGAYVNYEAEGVHYHKQACVCGNENSEVCADADPEHVAPACGVNGYYIHTCDACGFVWNVASDAEEDKAKEHNFDGAAWTQIPGEEKHIRYCQNDGCNESQTEDCSVENPQTGCGVQNTCDECGGNVGEYIDHNWTEVEAEELLKAAATCTTNAVYYKRCSNEGCGVSSKDVDDSITWTKTGTKLGHKMTANKYDITGWDFAPEGFDASVLKEPTCKDEGTAISYCERCSVYELNTIPEDANKHIWDTDANGNENWVHVSGNCATGVTYKLVCTQCSKTKTKTVPQEHDFKIVYEELPTCEYEGYRKLECSICEYVEEEYYDQSTGEPSDLAPLGHAVEEWTDGEATCKENKYKYGTCGTCNKIVIEESEEMGEHSFKTVAAEKATCDKPGHNEYQSCAVCGLEEGKTVITVPHKDKDGNDKCDECNRKLYTEDDMEKSCGCICHKESWIMRIIYKIINFFWKLFKISKTCDCGTVHW